MYFYDGPTYVAEKQNFKTIATYYSGEPMAIMHKHIGLIGCHPESEPHWYNSYSWMKGHYHNGKDHKLLLEFVNELMYGNQRFLQRIA